MSELNKLKEELQLLKEKIDSYEEAPVFWEPKDGEVAYFTTQDGSTRDSSSWDADEIAIGLGYKTAEEANEAFELDLVTQRLKKAVWELNGGVVPFSFDESNYCVVLGNEGLSVAVAYTKNVPNWFYLESTYDCEQLIKSHKDDLLLYLNQ